mmetsp:Transcript_29141/g.89099  ORF Transcript_29141/g.89099 Transcript_29141/m.89099 type:complete len:283 (+) Transcript_29141:37-885(+)
MSRFFALPSGKKIGVLDAPTTATAAPQRSGARLFCFSFSPRRTAPRRTKGETRESRKDGRKKERALATTFRCWRRSPCSFGRGRRAYRGDSQVSKKPTKENAPCFDFLDGEDAVVVAVDVGHDGVDEGVEAVVAEGLVLALEDGLDGVAELVGVDDAVVVLVDDVELVAEAGVDSFDVGFEGRGHAGDLAAQGVEFGALAAVVADLGLDEFQVRALALEGRQVGHGLEHLGDLQLALDGVQLVVGLFPVPGRWRERLVGKWRRRWERRLLRGRRRRRRDVGG